MTEEEIQRIYEYPQMKPHYRLHSDFVEKIQEFKKEIEIIGVDDMKVMSEYLQNWLINHILSEDKQLCAHLNAQGLN